MKRLLCIISSVLITAMCVCSCSSVKQTPTPVESKIPEKFTRLTLLDRCGEESATLEEIYNDMQGKATILDLMKFYSDEITKDPDINKNCKRSLIAALLRKP